MKIIIVAVVEAVVKIHLTSEIMIVPFLGTIIFFEQRLEQSNLCVEVSSASMADGARMWNEGLRFFLSASPTVDFAFSRSS